MNANLRRSSLLRGPLGKLDCTLKEDDDDDDEAEEEADNHPAACQLSPFETGKRGAGQEDEEVDESDSVGHNNDADEADGGAGQLDGDTIGDGFGGVTAGEAEIDDEDAGDGLGASVGDHHFGVCMSACLRGSSSRKSLMGGTYTHFFKQDGQISKLHTHTVHL